MKLTNKQKAIFTMLRDEPYRIGHFLGFKDLGVIHNEWLKSFLYSKEDQTLQAHRGSFKTTDLTLGEALLMVIYPNSTILMLRKTDGDVKAVLNQISKILQSGAMQMISEAIHGTGFVLTKDSTSEIDTSLHRSVSGQSQLMGLGLGGSLTGKHADIIITDDIVNLSDRISRAEREHTKQIYMELQNIRNRGGRFINCGTPWHKDDAFTLMPNIKRYDCYSTRLISESKLAELRQSMTPSLFAANYELKHIADENALFTAPQFTDDTEAIHNGIAHIDASYGGADGTAFTIIKKQDDGSIIAFGKRWNKHVNDCVGEIKALHSEYKAGTLYCERNADKGYLADMLRGEGVPVSTYHEKENKFIKISTHLKGKWANLFWLKATDNEYLNEILDYTENAAHDDAPDSAASAIRQIDKQIVYQGFKGGI